MPPAERSPSQRKKDAYGRISPATIAEVVLEIPKQARRAWIGITGSKEPNFQYEVDGRIIRRSLKHPDKLDATSFNPRNIVEIDPQTGALLEPHD